MRSSTVALRSVTRPSSIAGDPSALRPRLAPGVPLSIQIESMGAKLRARNTTECSTRHNTQACVRVCDSCHIGASVTCNAFLLDAASCQSACRGQGTAARRAYRASSVRPERVRSRRSRYGRRAKSSARRRAQARCIERSVRSIFGATCRLSEPRRRPNWPPCSLVNALERDLSHGRGRGQRRHRSSGSVTPSIASRRGATHSRNTNQVSATAPMLNTMSPGMRIQISSSTIGFCMNSAERA
jgi:hypothetical protein